MILIYSFYIFMIIVKFSNSINRNYAEICYKSCFFSEESFDDGARSYSCYQSAVRQFDVQLLDPQDFFFSIFNPYYLLLPLPYHTNYHTYDEFGATFLKQLYNCKKNQMDYSLTAQSNDLLFSGVDPLYWYPKRPKFYRLNKNITSVCALYNVANIYSKDVQEYDPEKMVQQIYENRAQEANKENEPSTLRRFTELEKEEIVTFEKVMEKKTNDAFTNLPNFKVMTPNEYEAIKKLMSYLPITGDFSTSNDEDAPKEEIDDYLKRHDETVKYYLYLNKNLYSHIQSNSIQKLSRDRVKNLKLPYLLKFESYNFYVLRISNMRLIPFHIEFLKNKFNVFPEEKQVTIFEELGVDLNIDVTQDDVPSDDVPTIDDLN